MSNFTIDTYDRRYLDGMCAVYNAETAFEAHIAPLNPDLFLKLVEPKPYFNPAGLLVAHEGGRVIGWIHACIAPGSEAWNKPDETHHRIRMLMFPADRLEAGRALVEEATRWLKNSGAVSIEAMHCNWGYPFYRGLFAGGEPLLPANFAHLHVALACGGYKNTHESNFMAGALAAAPRSAVTTEPIELVDNPAQMPHEGMRHSWTGFEPMIAQAMIGGESAGRVGWVVLPHLTRLGAPAVNVWMMGVNEKHRRKGIASALMAHALRRGFEQGARFTSVATQLWNVPAQGCYAHFGCLSRLVLVGREWKAEAAKPENGTGAKVT